MSWGNKLVIAFVVFAAFIGTLVYKCTQNNFELVSAKYYEDELKYQDKIDGAGNANKLSLVKIDQTTDELKIKLPDEVKGDAVTGQVLFYCASNADNDRTIEIKADSDGMMFINKKQLAKATYTAKINWQVGTTKYYNEQLITIK